MAHAVPAERRPPEQQKLAGASLSPRRIAAVIAVARAAISLRRHLRFVHWMSSGTGDG